MDDIYFPLCVFYIFQIPTVKTENKMCVWEKGDVLLFFLTGAVTSVLLDCLPHGHSVAEVTAMPANVPPSSLRQKRVADEGIPECNRVW